MVDGSGGNEDLLKRKREWSMGHVPALVQDWENGEKEHGGREKEREEIKKIKIKMYFNKGVGRGGGKRRERTPRTGERKGGETDGKET